eukprot:1297934-Prymnesium_polylepis.1
MRLQICRNADQLFQLKVGEAFECDLSDAKFAELRELLTGTWTEPPGAAQCAAAKVCIEVPPGEAPTCPMCWRVNGGGGDCSALAGCNNELCGFCTNS